MARTKRSYKEGDTAARQIRKRVRHAQDQGVVQALVGMAVSSPVDAALVADGGMPLTQLPLQHGSQEAELAADGVQRWGSMRGSSASDATQVHGGDTLRFKVVSSIQVASLPCTVELAADARVSDLKLEIERVTNQLVPAVCQELFVRPGPAARSTAAGDGRPQQQDMGVLLELGLPLREVLQQMGLPQRGQDSVCVFVALRDFDVHHRIRQALEEAVEAEEHEVTSSQRRRLGLAMQGGDSSQEVVEYAKVLAELHAASGTGRRQQQEQPLQQRQQAAPPSNSTDFPSPASSSDGGCVNRTASAAAAAAAAGGGTSSPAPRSSEGRRVRRETTTRKWTAGEAEVLISGVEQYGLGSWQVILDAAADRFNAGRTAIDLKDKWRNLCKVVSNPSVVTRSVRLSQAQRQRIADCIANGGGGPGVRRTGAAAASGFAAGSSTPAATVADLQRRGWLARNQDDAEYDF